MAIERSVPPILRCAVLVLLLATPARAEAISGPDGSPLTDAQRASVESGEILVHLADVAGSAVKKATAVAVIDASPEQVFHVLTDYEAFPEFMPYCRAVNVEERDGDHARVRYELDFPWPIGDRHYVLKLTNRSETRGETTVLINSWTYVPDSGNINDTYGTWEVLPHGKNRAIARYTVFTDPGGKVPGWAANMATDVSVPSIIDGIRKRVREVPEKEKPVKASGEAVGAKS